MPGRDAPRIELIGHDEHVVLLGGGHSSRPTLHSSLMRPISILSTAALALALSSPAWSQGTFDGCGTYELVNNCPQIVLGTGERYNLDSTGSGLQNGDIIHVAGDLDLSCFSVCFQFDGCIWGSVLGPCGGPIGDSYCTAAVNSTGSGAEIEANGSVSLASDNLDLTAGPVPNQPGLFFYGPGQTQVPFGNGFRCITGPFVRLPIVFASSSELFHDVDLGNLPSGGQINPGDTWNFQAWYRDPMGGGAAFNLSDGVEITFTP